MEPILLAYVGIALMTGLTLSAVVMVLRSQVMRW